MAFNQNELTKLERVLHRHVVDGSVPGLVALVAGRDETHVFPMGSMALDDTRPVQRDTIFRLASMTKPITAAAAMMLVEEGTLRLGEPIDRLAPELADRRVLRRIDGPLDDTVLARRAITLEDVLTFRLGWGIVFSDNYPIIEATSGLPGFGMPDPTLPITPDQFMARLGALPLMAQPGERWLYTTGSNVLGVLISRAAGEPLDVLLSRRIFEPLGMTDTGFCVPREKLNRFITGYMPRDGKLALFDPPDGMYSQPPAFPAGDSGLVSTADDYNAFARFMRSGLAPDGRRLISEASLRLMTSNHLSTGQREDGSNILGPARGWGYGLGVMVQDSPDGVPQGAYGWDGGFGTSWFNDPGRGLTAILLTQRVFDSPDPPRVHKEFWKAVNLAFDEDKETRSRA
jgi:CubicO group peptidase (beta-lactamase class C family)